MNRCLILAGLLISTALLAIPGASAQAIPTASRAGALTVGVTFSDATTDYAAKRVVGAGAYATFDLAHHLGVEANIKLLQFSTPNDIAERTYMAGLRYVYRKNRLDFYGKGLAGVGQIVAQLPYQTRPGVVPSTTFAAALGGGLDIRIPRNLTVRAIDFEYQDWPNFASNYGGNGLSPTVLSFGIAYRIR